MHEAIKGVVYRREDVSIDGKPLQKYIVALTVITDVDMKLDNGENVILHEGNAVISELLNSCKKYKPPYPLGQIHYALMTIPDIELDEFEEK